MVVKPSFEEFSELYKDHDLVLVYAEQLADIETPVSVLARFVEDEDVFLLESVERGERFGRYSFIGINPRGIFSIEQGVPYYQERQEGVERKRLSFQKCPLDALKFLVGGCLWRLLRICRRCLVVPLGISGMSV